jgi:FMN phosphatase YigB (HAD superfamily)
MKPDREAYAHALKSLGVGPSAVYFFDDLPANIAAARNVGINAFLVRGVAETEARLRAEGLHFEAVKPKR